MADSAFRITTGTVDFSGGIDSGRVPTAASQLNPNGLKPNQLAWLSNAAVRGGAIYPRPGFVELAAFDTDIGWFQGSKIYQPDFGNPYIIAQIGGRTFAIRTDQNNEIEELTIPGDPNPADLQQVWMCQAEQFMVIQDGQSRPLVYDGTTLFRLEENSYKPTIPVAEAMAYFMGRLWLGFGREVVGSDIVGSPATPSSGTEAYDYRDSVLYMTENEYEALGGTFRMPGNDGNIRALEYSANIGENSRGEGQLFIFTREAVYALNITPNRAEWQLQTEPTILVVQLKFGSVSDRCIVKINGDLFYQSLNGVNTLITAIRYFGQWGNTPVSREVVRATNLNDRSLSRFQNGMEYSNRVLQSVLPLERDNGIVFRGLLPLNFDVIGSLSERLPPVWEGIWGGLEFLQVLEADYGGLQRAFMLVRSSITGGIELWEMSEGNLTDFLDGEENRISWEVETASYDWGSPFTLKELDTIELWVDRIYGAVEIQVEYREDQQTCWRHWKNFNQCAARNDCELSDAVSPCNYPVQTYNEMYGATLVMPKAPAYPNESAGRPSNLAYSFQFRFKIKGSIRIRGFAIHAYPRDKKSYAGMVT
jgi:hypothetical protein